MLRALLKVGWAEKRRSGSRRVLVRDGYPSFVFAFHDKEEIGPRMLARIARHTGPTRKTCRPSFGQLTVEMQPTLPILPIAGLHS